MTIFVTATVFCRLLIRTARMEWTWIEIRQIIQKIVTVKIFSKLKKKATKVTLILNSLYYHFLRKNSTCSINTSKHNSWKEMKIFAHVNPLGPNNNIQNSQDWSSYKIWGISGENLIKDQSIFPLVIILLILTTFWLNDGLILLRENKCWSRYIHLQIFQIDL